MKLVGLFRLSLLGLLLLPPHALVAAARPAPLEHAPREIHGGVTWRFAEAERSSLARFRPLLEKFLPAGDIRAEPVVVTLFPDIQAMAEADGDCRFATFARRQGVVEIHVAADAPATPDLVSAVFASGLFLARHPEAGRRPALLAGYGAFQSGVWWGRGIAQWGPLLVAADLLPSAAELLHADEPAASDLLVIGGAGAAIAAWAASEGRPAVANALGSGAVGEETLRRYLAEAGRPAAAGPARRPLPPRFLRGISFAMSNTLEGSYLSRRCGPALDRLKSDWVGAVSVMPFAFQRSASSPEISLVGHSPREESEEAVLRAVESAKGKGMQVLVKPQIWLWRGFTGDISMRSDADWKAWFRAYRRFILRHALVAEAGRADMFDVGVELCATEKREAQWRSLIELLRLATGAPLVYSCNWGRGAATVPFWGALDAIGVDFYDPLSPSWHATDRELTEGARGAARPLAEAAARFGKPVYLTEVGYPPLAAAWVSPSDENAWRPYSVSDSARAARAVFEAFGELPWCRGFFWWKAFSDGRESRGPEKTFNILGRPIEDVIRGAYRRLAFN